MKKKNQFRSLRQTQTLLSEITCLIVCQRRDEHSLLCPSRLPFWSWCCQTFLCFESCIFYSLNLGTQPVDSGKMASGLPMMNGDLTSPRASHGAGTSHVEETLQQMNILIKENRELKGQRVAMLFKNAALLQSAGVYTRFQSDKDKVWDITHYLGPKYFSES